MFARTVRWLDDNFEKEGSIVGNLSTDSQWRYKVTRGREIFIGKLSFHPRVLRCPIIQTVWHPKEEVWEILDEAELYLKHHIWNLRPKWHHPNGKSHKDHWRKWTLHWQSKNVDL